MNFQRPRHRRAPAVIIVSLIDVLLVVLIFLMVTTTFKKDQPSFKIALPTAEHAQAGAKEGKPPMIVTIGTAEPFFYIESRPVTYDRLKSELASRAQANPQLKLAIRTDKDSPVGQYIRVMDAARAANVASVETYTEKPSKL